MLKEISSYFSNIGDIGALLAVLTSIVGIIAGIERYSNTARARQTVEWVPKVLEKEKSPTRSKVLEALLVYSEAQLFAVGRFPSGAFLLISYAIIYLALAYILSIFDAPGLLADIILFAAFIFLGGIGGGGWLENRSYRLIAMERYRDSGYNMNLIEKSVREGFSPLGSRRFARWAAIWICFGITAFSQVLLLTYLLIRSSQPPSLGDIIFFTLSILAMIFLGWLTRRDMKKLEKSVIRSFQNDDSGNE